MIFRSPYPDITVPDVPLHHLVLQRATGLGDKPALIDGPSGRTLTYGQLARGVERVAAALGARGFGTGDVLGLYAELPRVRARLLRRPGRGRRRHYRQFP